MFVFGKHFEPSPKFVSEAKALRIIFEKARALALIDKLGHKRLARDKHSSLFVQSKSDKEKKIL
jgi:hypothetical protein